MNTGLVNVKWFGAKGIGTDDSSFIQNAINSATAGATIYSPSGIYGIGTQITTSDSVPVKLVGDGFGSQWKKLAAIDMLSLGKQSTMVDLYLEGNGSVYAGRGIVISTGALDGTSWRNIDRSYILNFAGYPVEFTQGQAGYFSKISNSYIWSTNLGVDKESIKLPDTETNGDRSFINVNTFGGKICHFGGSKVTLVEGCTCSGWTLTSTSNKVVFVGNRVANAASVVFDGTQHVFSANVLVATGITFNAGFQDSVLRNNKWGGSITLTDNSSDTKSLDVQLPRIGYTVNWTGASANPSIGNGALDATYYRDGDCITVSIRMIAGSTTSFGTGYWSFSLPYQASNRQQAGSCFLNDFGVAAYSASAVVDQSDYTSIHVVTNNLAATGIGPSLPWTWKAQDQCVITMTYFIGP